MTEKSDLYGILGYPLGHSLSPVLHNWGFQRLGLNARYEKWEKRPEELTEFFRGLRALQAVEGGAGPRIMGLSVTIPYKEAVMPFLDGLTPQARAVGAVNTLFWQADALWGDNTDVAGFTATLHGLSFDSALVLGAGGAARAVLYALAGQGADATVSARRIEQGEGLAREFGSGFLPWSERTAGLTRAGRILVVNATPLGMQGTVEGQSALTPADWRRARNPLDVTAYDLVYNPGHTVFLAGARAAGCRTLEGLELFLAQGAAQFCLWTGLELPLAAARAELFGQAAGR